MATQSDITSAIYEAVVRMVGTAATRKLGGNVFIVDEAKGDISDFIKQQVVLVTFDECSTILGQTHENIRVVRDGIQQTIYIAVPISYYSMATSSQDHSIAQDEKMVYLQLKIRAFGKAKLKVYPKATDGEGPRVKNVVEGAVKGVRKVPASLLLVPYAGLAAVAVGGVVGAARGGLSGQLHPVTLTAAEIFKEGDEFARDEKRAGYITCVISCPYTADFDITSVTDN